MDRRSFFKWLTTSVGSLVGLSSVISARTQEPGTQEKALTETDPSSTSYQPDTSTSNWTCTTTGCTSWTVNVNKVVFYDGTRWVEIKPECP